MSHFPTSLRRKLPLIFSVLGIVLMCVGVFYRPPHESNLSNSTNLTNSSVVVRPKTIKIDIAGAVEKPGLYELPYDSRIQDVLISAGGLSPKANRNYLSKNINLAQKVSDGQKIYVPSLDEVSPNLPNSTNETNSFVNINSSSLKDLDSLPGIGPVTAQKIIDNRPYASVDDLISKKIISQSAFTKIKSQISL